MITDWTTYHRNYWYKRRQRIIDYLGGKCAICGSTENLEVDHIDRANKSFNVGSRCSLKQIKNELNKCQLLCAVHHREKTANEQRGFTHGTIYGWMKVKCKCDICTKAKWQWHDKRNAKRNGPRGPYRKTRRSPIRQETTDSKPVQ